MFGFTTRIGVLISIPVLSAFKRANAGPLYQTAVTQYPNELIISLCLLMMVIGCLASALTPDPEGVTPTKPMTKFVYSLFGSLGAMFYIAHYETELTLVHAAWVGGVSFVSPSIMPSLKALIFDLLPVALAAVKTWISGTLDRLFGGKGGKSNE